MPTVSYEDFTTKPETQKAPSKVSYDQFMGTAADPAETADTPLARQLVAARRADPTGAMAAPPGIPDENIPDLMTADLSAPERQGVGEKFVDAATDVTRGAIDLFRSAGQRTSPVVRDVKGDFIRPYVGEFTEVMTSEGNIPMARGEDGQRIPVDPEKMAVLYDPVTRKDQVFLRTDETEAGLAESAGHMLGAGMVTNTATRPAGGVVPKAVSASPKTQLVEDFAQQGVRASQPVISQGRASGAAAQGLANVPVAGAPIIRSIQQSYDDTVQAVNRIASRYGVGGGRDRAGRIIQGGVERAGKRLPGAQGAASLPSRSTSFATKAEALYNRATGLVGDGATATMTRTREAIDAIMNKYGVESIDQLLRNPELKNIGEALSETAELPFDAARGLRSEVGKLTRSGGDEVLRTMAKADVDRLYGAMTEDLMAAATRAGGQQAAQALKRADQFYAAGNKRISESLQKLFKADSPELAYERLVNMLSEKTTANMQAAYALKRTLRPEEWNDIVATTIERLGKPTAGAASNVPGDQGFSISTFTTNYNKFSDKGKELLFGGPLRKEMEALARVVSAQKNFERLRNTSNTAPNLMTFLLGSAATVDLGTTAVGVGGARAVSEVLMSPKLVKWLHQAGTARLPSEQAAMMANLQKLVQEEPHLAIPLQRMFAAADSGGENSQPSPRQ